MQFEFKPLTQVDFPLMMHWHEQAHVREHWNPFPSYEVMCASYEKKMSGDTVFCFVVKLDDKPIAYIQAYKAWKIGDGWWPNENEGCWGMDMFIGDPAFTGQSLGPRFIDQFVHDFLAKQNCKRVIVDPAPKNVRAIRAYEKAGFDSEGEIETPDGKAILMVRCL